MSHMYFVAFLVLSSEPDGPVWHTSTTSEEFGLTPPGVCSVCGATCALHRVSVENTSQRMFLHTWANVCAVHKEVNKDKHTPLKDQGCGCGGRSGGVLLCQGLLTQSALLTPGGGVSEKALTCSDIPITSWSQGSIQMWHFTTSGYPKMRLRLDQTRTASCPLILEQDGLTV